MGLQTAKREERFPIPVVQKLFPVTKTVAGFEGARFVTAVSGADAVAAIPGSYALSTNASVGISMGGVYYAGVGEYDPDFVASVLAADAAKPEASFDNVVDMLDWLNRD